jgi:sirohydrochlorin ferrochelatase
MSNTTSRDHWLANLYGTDDDAARTGIILVDHGSRRGESNRMLEDLAQQWQLRQPNAVIEPAHMELASPTIADAFQLCVQRDAQRVVLSPFFLLPGRHWTDDLPRLLAEAAKPFPHIEWLLAPPIGTHELVLSILEDRIATCVTRG